MIRDSQEIAADIEAVRMLIKLAELEGDYAESDALYVELDVLEQEFYKG